MGGPIGPCAPPRASTLWLSGLEAPPSHCQKVRWVFALLMVAALARAAPLTVEKAPVDLLHAERVDITERFEIVRIELATSTLGARATGDVEIGETLPPANTDLSLGEWSYAVVLREREPDGVPEGVFEVRLTLAGQPAGEVRLVQRAANELVQEGATVRFGLGDALPAAPLLVVSVREIPQGPVFELTTALNSSFAYVWQDEDSVQNATLRLRVGLTATFVAINGEATSPHNLQILDGSNSPPTTPDLLNVGDEETLAWTPPSTGTFVYRCQYHSNTMQGRIEVTE